MRSRRPEGVDALPVRVILLSDGTEGTSEEQFHAFSAYRSELKAQLRLISLHLLLKDVLRAPKFLLKPFDIIILKFSFRTAGDEAIGFVRQIRRAVGSRPIVYYDGDDDLCIQWPAILAAVDLYVKKHIFRDKNRYLNSYIGKNNLTDYVHRRYGYSFADNNHAQETRPIATDQLYKIMVGGNLALDSNIMELYSTWQSRRQGLRKDVDIMFRGNVPKDWLHYLRKDIEPALSRLQVTYKVIIPRKRVNREEYYLEMTRSKICVSPFGYGEICWRDFEALICGCLLIKPDMSHIETLPNIFKAHETYVPVSWDYSDLEEKCLYYLNLSQNCLSRMHRAASCTNSRKLVGKYSHRTMGGRCH